MKSWDLAAGQIDEMMMILCIQFASIEVYSISAWERKYIVWLCYKIEMFEQIPHFFQIPNFFFFLRRWLQKSARNSTCDQLCTHSNALDGRSRNKTETYRMTYDFFRKMDIFLAKVIFFWYWFVASFERTRFEFWMWAASAFGLFHEMFSAFIHS